MNHVVFEQAEILTPLGNCSETIDNLFHGTGAITEGPCFGVPVAYASFGDTSFRALDLCAEKFKHEIISSAFVPEKTVFIYCAAKGDIRALEQKECTQSPLLDEQARLVCDVLAIEPKRIMVVSNACASGNVGIELASDLLQSGAFSQAILFSFDTLSRFVVSGFHALSALSEAGARPFDAERDGLTLGDGAAISLLSYRKAAPGDIIVAGCGSSNDANHRTGPSPTGEGLYRAAQAALENANMLSEEVGAIKCHGTATEFNDAMEAKMLDRLFKEGCPPAVSLKGAIGHLSGSSSLVEAALSCAFIKKRTLPKTFGFEKSGVEESIGISAQPQQFSRPSVLSLSAGFGGLNSAILLKENA